MAVPCNCLPRRPRAECGSAGPVTVNVGGTRYTTSRETLSRCHKIKALISGPPGPDGTYFLDRDGRTFAEVLAFLRDGPQCFIAPYDMDARRLLQQEAAFFELSELSMTVQHAYAGAPVPQNELERLHRLDSLNIMHTNEHESHFDAITKICSALINVPITLISLVGDDHQWFKSRVGIEANRTDRHTSFCAFTFKPEHPTAASMFVIENAKSDPRVAKNPLVLGPPHIAFYAGCPLVTSDGMRLGALCAIDGTPRSISALQAQIMVNLGQLATAELESQEHLGGFNVEDGDEDNDREDQGEIPGAADWAAGPMRLARMRETLREAICLVQVSIDSMEWPVLYGNKSWTARSGICITPPERLPGRAEAEVTQQGGSFHSPPTQLKEPLFFDLFQVKDKSQEALQAQLRYLWALPEPAPFALSGYMKVLSNGGSCQERLPVSFRFMPADLPIDAAAAAIRPVPLRSAGEPYGMISGISGRLYFVTVAPSKQAPQRAVPTPGCGQPPPKVMLTPVSESLASSSPRRMQSDAASSCRAEAMHTPASESLAGSSPRQMQSDAASSCGSGSRVVGKLEACRGNTVDAVGALKKPRSAFDEVKTAKLVGQGSFGRVYYGLWLGSPVAVKSIEHRSKAQHRKFQPEFEAMLSESMAHPNLVQTFLSSSRTKHDSDDGGAGIVETWLVQEWCDLGTLGTYCSRPRTSPECLEEVVEISADIARAGDYLHSRGIIHGDLTASNVLLKTQVSRKGYVCKVCDFGLARVLEGDTVDIMTTQLGTVTHMPPELFAAELKVRLTMTADVYAAGILLWQVLRGEQPFAGLSPPQVIMQIAKGKKLQLPPEAAQGLREVFDQCTASSPESRPKFDQLINAYWTILSDCGTGSQQQLSAATNGNC